MSTRKPKTRYDYNRLKQYCDENNIVLTKDYIKEKINVKTIIEANCLNCSREVKKNFRNFLISGCFCETCTKQNARLITRESRLNNGFDIDYLELIKEKINIYNCTDVSINGKPISEYRSTDINRKLKINFTCNCGEKENKFILSFVELMSDTNADGGKCRICIRKESALKRRETRIKTGLDTDFLKLIKEIIDKYKCTDVSIDGKPISEYQSKEIHRHLYIDFTCSCGEKQHKPVRDFVELTFSEADGGKCEKCIKINSYKKMKETCLNRYGVEWFSQSQIVKDKMTATNMERHGCKYAMQNAEIFDKQQKSALKRKEYTFPSGRIDSVQGYEPQALDIIIQSYEEDDIVTSNHEIELLCGEMKYTLEGKEHKYYTDIYIKSSHTFIEVKSIWTFESEKEKNLKKREACINAGINFEFWIMSKEGKLLEKI